MPPAQLESSFHLLDWRRRIFALYREVREAPSPEVGWERWRAVRDDLLKHHPQSPLPDEAQESFEGLDYFDYDPALRVIGNIEHTDPQRFDVPTSGDESFAFSRIGRAHFDLASGSHTLDVFWMEDYAGGIFLPVRDATSGKETYGAGRYLYDTVKGADLGGTAEELILDFNFAYNPSCSYDSRWVCPLAPPGNRLPVALRAGERHKDG
ncbi:MAG: DUF1684 domain-containing protein [Actinomycetota bacterium]|nr:DUF1684 domain-containing protein [Actinomycetota bacterium]